MQILAAVDPNSYSTRAVDEAARLAANTWANVDLLEVRQDAASPAASTDMATSDSDTPATAVLVDHRSRFLSHFTARACPYAGSGEAVDALQRVRTGVYERRSTAAPASKVLTLRLRTGPPVREIVADAREAQSDLIVLGCDAAGGCSWSGESDVPRKVAADAPCSVLVVKRNEAIRRVVCCLDHDRVSQASLEMINQMVTLHQAQLTLIGLTDPATLDAEVEANMATILSYYQARGIDPRIELVNPAALDTFIAREAHWDLVALWLGKPSFLKKIFPPSRVATLIRGGDASVLMLR